VLWYIEWAGLSSMLAYGIFLLGFFLLTHVLNCNIPCLNFKSLNIRPFLHCIWRFLICDFDNFHTWNQCYTICIIVHSHNSTLFSSCANQNSKWKLRCVLSQSISLISIFSISGKLNANLFNAKRNVIHRTSLIWSRSSY